MASFIQSGLWKLVDAPCWQLNVVHEQFDSRRRCIVWRFIIIITNIPAGSMYKKSTSRPGGSLMIVNGFLPVTFPINTYNTA